MLVKLLKAPISVFRDLVLFFITYMPGGTGNRMRYWYYRHKFKRCGENVIIDMGVTISGAELISIGDNVHIDKFCIIATGKNIVGKVTEKPNKYFSGHRGELIIGSNVHIVQFCILMGYGGIEIGDNCVLSSGCKIYSLTNTAYDLDNPSEIISIMPYSNAPFLVSPVVLRRNVWLGLNTVTMPSSTILEDSFSTSNTIVNGVFAANSYLEGQPARRIRQRFRKEDGE